MKIRNACFPFNSNSPKVSQQWSNKKCQHSKVGQDRYLCMCIGIGSRQTIFASHYGPSSNCNSLVACSRISHPSTWGKPPKVEVLVSLEITVLSNTKVCRTSPHALSQAREDDILLSIWNMIKPGINNDTCQSKPL